MCIDVAAHTGRTQLLDVTRPWRRQHDAIQASASELGRLAHHRSSAGSCAPRPTASVANDAASPDQLSCSHMFTVFGHTPVDPMSAQTP